MKFRPIRLLIFFIIMTAVACQSGQNAPTPADAPLLGPNLSPSVAFTSPALTSEPSPTKTDLDDTSLVLDSVVLFLNSGGRVDWSPDGTLIAYDAFDPQGFSQTRLVSIQPV